MIEMGRHPRFRLLVSMLGSGGIIAVGLLNCVTHVPYTGVLYNRLVGSPENGARIEWLNFNAGSGYEQAARYIHQVYGDDMKVLGSGEIGWMNMSYPNVYTVGTLPAETNAQDVYELIQDYDIVVIHRMETQRRPHFVFHRFFAQQTPIHRIIINGVEAIQIFDVRQVKPFELEMDETTQNSRMASSIENRRP
jgi:hypothetical protein